MFDDADRSRLFWRLQIAGWTAYCLLAAAFMGSAYFDLGGALAISLFRTGFGFLATCGMRLLYRRWRGRGLPFLLSGGGVLLLCGGVALMDGEATWLFAQAFAAGAEEEAMHQFLFASILMRWMVYWVWSLLYFGIRLWLDTERTRLREAQARAAAQESELRFLRAQINPHFLFNALNTILAETGDPKTRTLVQALADYLHFSFRPHARYEPLGVEMEALTQYLAVEQARFLERLACRIDVSEEARKALAPPATVQPLLENAMKYGWQTSPERLELEICARVSGDRLEIRVWNSGRWVVPEEHLSTRTGLDNLRRRLTLLYGDKATLDLTYDARGVSAGLSLPCTPL